MTTLARVRRSLPFPSSRRQLLDAACLGPLLHAPGRALVAVLAIALGVALGFAVHLVNRVAASEVQLAARSLFGIADLSVQAAGSGLDESLYPQLARLPGIAVASPVVEVSARLPARARSLQLIGVDPFRMSQLQAPLAALGATAMRTTGVLAEDALWLSPSAAEALGLAVGQTLVVQAGLQTRSLRVTGLLPAGVFRQQIGMLDIAEAQWRFGRPGRIDRIDLRLAPGANASDVTAAIAAVLPPGARLITPGDSSEDALRLSRAYRSNLTALALVALFTGAFLVYSTQALNVARRRREIAFLHALGMTVREQLIAILLAGAIVGVVGAAIGVVLGYLAARAGLASFGADLGAGYFRGLAPQVDFRPIEGLTFFALGVVAAVVATLAPAREAASVPAAAALKSASDSKFGSRKFGSEPNYARKIGTRKIGSEPNNADSNKPGSELNFGAAPRRQRWVGVLLLAAAVVVLWLPPIDGLALPGYAAIACLLLGAVLLTPGVAHAVFERLPARGPAWRQVATAQLRGTAHATTVSVAAVLVSFSLMVAMAIMVQSFRESLDTWMQRILPADLYLRAGSGRSTAYFSADDQQRLAAVAGVVRVDFVRSIDVVLPGGGPPLNLIARSIDEDSATGLLPLRREADGRAPAGTIPVWASEAALDLHGLDVDTEFDLPLGATNVRASVRGLWRDYERPGGAIVLSRQIYIERTGDDRVGGAALWIAPSASLEDVGTAVGTALPGGGVYDIARPGEIRRLAMGTFDRTFAVTYLLEAIAVLIGIAGISAATSARVLARRAEFGMLRHVGVLRGEIGRLLAFEGAVLGALGVVGGLIVGAVVSLILIYVVNRQSFHWTMDLRVPWALLGGLSAALIAAAAATAVVSGRLAMSANVVRVVREDW